ncbi:hypothetical protein DYB28_015855, partial [Aphanomyces astaci]
DDDLEYYVKEAAGILGILPKLDPDRADAKHVLEFLLSKVVNFKKLNQDLLAMVVIKDKAAPFQDLNEDDNDLDDMADAKSRK